MDSQAGGSSEQHGTHKYANYNGDLKNGRMQGKGVYFFPNGVKYVGEWNDGQFHGKGI